MNKTKFSILHISAHLGGGVGKALSSILTYENQNNINHNHKLILLDTPENYQFIDICTEGGVEVIFNLNSTDIISEIKNADIVIIHWWNHPIMSKFLADFPDINIRLVLWTHVNGCNYPCLPFDFINVSHKTFFTSPFSYENSFWSQSQKKIVSEKALVVYGLGILQFYDNILRVHDEKVFKIGYVGTLNKSKLHPDFVQYCKAVVNKIPTALFIMVGDSSHSKDILLEAKGCGIEDNFIFTGYTNQVIAELAKFDVFAYPLTPKHFGTTENVLLEAMAFGLPVVVLDHCSEKYIVIDHNQVGLLADCPETYADCLKYLYDNPKERIRIGNNAKNYVKDKFTFVENVELMRNELDKVLEMKPRKISFKNIFGKSPHEWFLACLGEDSVVFQQSINSKIMDDYKKRSIIENKIKNSSPILREKTKSSIYHFSKTFPEDKILQYWSSVIDA